ncbi:MAG TPA: serine protease, partial [Haliea salexigens]|nr:serine protease [Haliea salexigens]
ASSNQAGDGDTNDTASLYTPNDMPGSAQALANPVTLGGYINQPGTGAEGRSQLRGDIDDYFRLELLAAQSVTLLVADFEDADADLYLYNEAGEVIDFSVETGEIETVTAPENGTYLVNVTAFLGATNYILAVGSPALDSAPRTDAELVPGEIIVEFAESEILAPGFFHADLAYQMGMQERAGGPGRARLLEILAGQAERQRLGTAARRKNDFQNNAR